MENNTQILSGAPLEIKNNVINETVLNELKAHLVQPLTPLGKIVLSTVFLGVSAILILLGKNNEFLAFGLIMSAVMMIVPKFTGARTVKAMVKTMKQNYGVPYCAYDLTLEPNAVKSINSRTHVTGRIPYTSLKKIVETKSALALFTKESQLVAYDRSKLTPETRAQIISTIEANNPGIEKHLQKK